MKMGRLHSLLLLGLAVCSGWAQAPVAGTVENLVRAVRAALQELQADKQIAQTVEGIHLTAGLDDEVIEQLQAEGVGPLATEALERLRDVSFRLPSSTAPLKLSATLAAPSAEEQSRVLEQARTWAMQYTANLPNYVCTREVSRYTKGKDPAPWKIKEALTWELGYADRKDYQKLVAINGRPTKRKGTRGFTSGGEFGSFLGNVFQREPETKFQWSRWSNLRGCPTWVFSYHVDKKHSGFVLGTSGWITSRRVVTAIRGFVYIDSKTHQIMRIIYDADEIPSGFPMQGCCMLVDYGYVEIGADKFLLPVRSTMRIVTKGVIGRNVTEFTKYRKFTSEVRVEFEKQ